MKKKKLDLCADSKQTVYLFVHPTSLTFLPIEYRDDDEGVGVRGDMRLETYLCASQNTLFAPGISHLRLCMPHHFTFRCGIL